MNNALIREARPGDARGIAEVHVASWIAAYTGLLPAEKMAKLDVEERHRAWRERLDNPGETEIRAWVAVLDGSIIGFASTRLTEDHDLDSTTHELAALYLVPSVWQKGIGTRLMAAAETSLREAGVKKASLWVLERNADARTFYESRGWIFDKRDSSFKDFGAPALRYRKSL